MSRRYESPKNLRKTNPMEYQDYENVKERHYLGKYRPEDDDDTDFRDNNERIDRICEMNGLIKPCYDIIERNSSFFERLKQVNSVIVMGHSYSDIDLPYFKKVKSSILPEATWKMGWHTTKDKSVT